jgi:parallel beta-helix repeat protein
MMLMTWQRALAQRAKTFRRGFALKRRHHSFRPMVEMLEDRMLLSTIFTVTDPTDAGGPNTLRAAIIAVNSGLDNEIDFNLGSSGVQTITLKSALPVIQKSVFINGGSEPGFSGTPLVVINGNGVSGNGFVLDGVGSVTSNTISGLVIENFTGNGILIDPAFSFGSSSGGSDNNLIQNNFIGTDATGTAAAPNGFDGVLINGSSGNQIIGNLISGNSGDGVVIDGGQNNLVQGNFIGTDISGGGRIPNGNDGVLIEFASNNTVESNTITGNHRNGVEIDDAPSIIGMPGTGTGFNQVVNNLITDNGSNASFDNGVLITGSAGSDNFVHGNTITGNIGNGVGIISDDNNIVSGNTIDNNVAAGVAVGFTPFSFGSQTFLDTSAVGNVIMGNSIFNNGSLGIDLNSDGVPTPADPNADPSPGPNDLLPYPQLLSATNGITATVSGILHSFVNGMLTIEFFASTQPDPSGFGEGQFFIPAATVTVLTDSSGNASFTSGGFAPLAGAPFITATATFTAPLITTFATLSTNGPSAFSETSEFSNVIELPPPPPQTPPGDTTTITIISRPFVPPIPPVIPPLPLPQSIALPILPPPNNPLQLVSEFFSRQPLVESPGEIHGRIWEDPNASGQKGDDTLPLAGQIVFIDANNNGVFDEGERWTVTNEKGEYSFTGLPSGTYTVLPLLGRGQDQTFNTARENKVELRSGAMVVDNVDIGIRQRAMRRRRTADAIRYPSMERALAIALDANALEGLNGPERPLAVPEEAMPVPLAAVIAPVPAAQDEPVHQSAWWQALLAAALIGPWCVLSALQTSDEREGDVPDDDLP